MHLLSSCQRLFSHGSLSAVFSQCRLFQFFSQCSLSAGFLLVPSEGGCRYHTFAKLLFCSAHGGVHSSIQTYFSQCTCRPLFSPVFKSGSETIKTNFEVILELFMFNQIHFKCMYGIWIRVVTYLK